MMEQSMSGGGAQGSTQGQPQSPLGLDGDPGSDLMASQMDRLAQLALSSGLPEKAKEYASTASTLRHNASTISANNLNATIKHLNMLGSLMEGVHDERSWRQANAMYALQTGKPTPYAKQPYNPQLVDQLKMGVMTAKDRALTAAAKAREKSSAEEVEERTLRKDLIKAQTELTKSRTTALKKAGATPLPAKAAEIRAITDLIIKDYGAGVLPEDARVLARPVAEQMVRIMKDTSLPASQAAQRAYQEAKSNGAFGGLRPRPKMTGSADRPLDIPEDSSKLRPNMYYKGKGKHTGKTFLWTGAAFVPVGTGPGEIQPIDEDNEDVVSDEDLDSESDNPDDYVPAKEPE